jgi:hypothetical protein
MWLCVVVTPTLQVEGVFGFQRVSVSDTCDYIPLFYFQKLLPVSMSYLVSVYGVVWVCVWIEGFLVSNACQCPTHVIILYFKKLLPVSMLYPVSVYGVVFV